MSFIDLCQKRYSCRAYSEQMPEREAVMAVLEAARLAPSATNRQPWKFYVVTDPERRARMLQKSRPAFTQAPVLVVAVGYHADSWHRPSDGKDHTDVDLSIAVEHICLAAADVSLGTCWICSFDVEAVRDELHLPDDQEPIALIPIGYPAEGSVVPRKIRKPIEEITEWVD